MSDLGGWARLDWGDRLRLPVLMLALPLVSLSLRLCGYQRTRRLVDRLSRHPTPRRMAMQPDIENARHLARLAAIAGRRGPIQSSCLRQSLLVYGLLRRRGLLPEIRIGVTGDRYQPLAHAWVELAGEPLDAKPPVHHAYAAG